MGGNPHEISLFRGEPGGFASVEDRATDIHLAELVLAPHYEGQAIGTSVLGTLIEYVRARRVLLHLRTHRPSRAVNLYRRIGVRQIGSPQTHLLFEWSADDETRN